jgi:hypothetical protein
MGFTASTDEETAGLDRGEHGETGFDFGLAEESTQAAPHEPRAALVPPNGKKPFQVVVEGINSTDLMKAWSDLCQPSPSVATEFKAVYPFLTTVQDNRFRFRGGEQEAMRHNLQKLFETRLSKPLKAKLEV